MTKPSLDVRHRLLDVRMFDEFTTSNAESEHAALKSRGTGITNLTTLTDLFLKSMNSAEMRSYDKEVKNKNDLEKTETTTHAILSKHVTKPCFNAMKKLVQCATRCISKQSDRSNWIVIFMPTKNQTVQPNADLHFLPRIKRKRYVTITNSVLHCSCKKMERFGYPCHHLLHVIGCKSIHDIKPEWIHIRWFKKYLVEYYEPSTDDQTQKKYDYMYINHPNGIPCIPSNDFDISYPIIRAPEDIQIRSFEFDVPDYQFLCRKSPGMLWFEHNKSNNPLLNQMLQRNETNIFEKEINLSQSQQSIDDLMTNEFDIQIDDVDEDHLNSSCQEGDCFTMWKRAQSLCENNKSKQMELYNLLEEFVVSSETSHNDNKKLLSKKSSNETTTISSNKIIHNKRSGAKRKRYTCMYEKK